MNSLRTFLLIVAQVILPQDFLVAVRGRVDDAGVFGGQVLIKSLLVKSARLAVNRHEERLETHRLDVLFEVHGRVFRNLLDAARRLHHLLEFYGPVEDGV